MSYDVEIIELPKITDPRGNLSFYESLTPLPFEIKRVYWIYDVPGDECRGGHAYKKSAEFIVALSGSFDVVVDNGISEKRIHLNRSYYGLLIPKLHWRSLENFSTNSLACIASNSPFDAKEYIYSKKEYYNIISKGE